jgi:hypothetical protein
MPLDAKPLTDAQRQALCRMMHLAFIEIRSLGSTGADQASALADAFHNLPTDMWQDYFTLSFFRDVYLSPYQDKYPRGVDSNYVGMINEIIGMAG